uniref:Ig-like domain-containing protein n=1 Tax=Macrostomum lignano TaxID=282301 RepID=A0A1I8IAT7_9PLAT
MKQKELKFDRSMSSLLRAHLCLLVCTPVIIDFAASETLGVNIRVNVTLPSIQLSCDVTNGGDAVDAHEVQFYCPAAAPEDDSIRSQKCFGDCNPICVMQADATCKVMHQELLPPRTQCRKILPLNGAKTVQLLVDTSVERLAGEWYCKFRDIKEHPGQSLSHYKMPPPPPPPPVTAKEPTTTAVAKTVEMITTTVRADDTTSVGGSASEKQLESPGGPAGPMQQPDGTREVDPNCERLSVAGWFCICRTSTWFQYA